MKVLSAEFVTSAAPRPGDGNRGGSARRGASERLVGVPRDGLPQVAMVGRSNVGKSTLINALGRRKIARTSAAPGKTRLANIYRLTVERGPGTWGLYLVDLPGYGYARRSSTARHPEPAGGHPSRASGQGDTDDAAELREIAEAYFAAAVETARAACLLLVDSRHPGLEADVQAARWLESMNVEYRVAATKVDKLSRNERARNLKALEISIGMPAVAVSATSGEGLDELWKTIASLVRTGRG